jgi:hypothetical protein
MLEIYLLNKNIYESKENILRTTWTK